MKISFSHIIDFNYDAGMNNVKCFDQNKFSSILNCRGFISYESALIQSKYVSMREFLLFDGRLSGLSLSSYTEAKLSDNTFK